MFINTKKPSNDFFFTNGHILFKGRVEFINLFFFFFLDFAGTYRGVQYLSLG